MKKVEGVWSRTGQNVNSLALLVVIMVIVPMSGDCWSAEFDRILADSVELQYHTFETKPPKFDSSTTLDDYLAYAAIESPSLRRAFYEWKSALEKTGYAGALPDPMVSYAKYIENVETRVGPQNHRFSFKQSFPWFGTLGARRDIAQERANAYYRKYQGEKLRLFYSVKAAYYNYYYLGRDIAITADNFELMEFWESIARAKYKVALVQHPDIIKAQVELGKLEDRLLTLKDRIKPTVAQLRAVLNLSDTVILPMPTTIAGVEKEIDGDSVLGLALDYNPNLNAMLHLIDRERAGVRLANKSTLPNFTIGVDYIETGQALNPSTLGSGKDPWVIGVSLNLPIWFGKNNARKREAAAKLRSAEYDYVDTQNRLTEVVEMLVFKYSDALRKVKLYRDGLIPKAEQSLNASYTAYQAGKADFLNVLDAQRELLAFQLQFERAWADLATRRAEIEMISGREIKN